jgi:hypothetical protein
LIRPGSPRTCVGLVRLRRLGNPIPNRKLLRLPVCHNAR